MVEVLCRFTISCRWIDPHEYDHQVAWWSRHKLYWKICHYTHTTVYSIDFLGGSNFKFQALSFMIISLKGLNCRSGQRSLYVLVNYLLSPLEKTIISRLTFLTFSNRSKHSFQGAITTVSIGTNDDSCVGNRTHSTNILLWVRHTKNYQKMNSIGVMIGDEIDMVVWLAFLSSDTSVVITTTMHYYE